MTASLLQGVREMHEWRGTLRKIAAVGLGVVLGTGLVVGAPPAPAERPPLAGPGSVRLVRMNRALGGLIGLVAADRIEPGSDELEVILDYVLQQKYAFIAEIPYLGTLRFADVYSMLYAVDSGLRGARGEAAGVGIDTEDDYELNSLRQAQDYKESLEATPGLFDHMGPKRAKDARDLLRDMNSTLTELIGTVQDETPKVGSKEWLELHDRIIGLEKIKRRFLNFFPMPFPGVKFGELVLLLEELDINLWYAGGEMNIRDAPSSLDKDELFKLLGKAHQAKQDLEKLLGFEKKAGRDSTPKVVATGTSDHDPPQSDLCVLVQIEARVVETRRDFQKEFGRAWVELAGPAAGAVGPPTGQLVRLDANGQGLARFLVTRTGVYRAKVVGIARNGMIGLTSVTIDNTAPSAEPCVA